MTDRLGEALARWDEGHPFEPYELAVIVAAARSWHALSQRGVVYGPVIVKAGKFQSETGNVPEGRYMMLLLGAEETF